MKNFNIIAACTMLMIAASADCALAGKKKKKHPQTPNKLEMTSMASESVANSSGSAAANEEPKTPTKQTTVGASANVPAYLLPGFPMPGKKVGESPKVNGKSINTQPESPHDVDESSEEIKSIPAKKVLFGKNNKDAEEEVTGRGDDYDLALLKNSRKKRAARGKSKFAEPQEENTSPVASSIASPIEDQLGDADGAIQIDEAEEDVTWIGEEVDNESPIVVTDATDVVANTENDTDEAKEKSVENSESSSVISKTNVAYIPEVLAKDSAASNAGTEVGAQVASVVPVEDEPRTPVASEGSAHSDNVSGGSNSDDDSESLNDTESVDNVVEDAASTIVAEKIDDKEDEAPAKVEVAPKRTSSGNQNVLKFLGLEAMKKAQEMEARKSASNSLSRDSESPVANSSKNPEESSGSESSTEIINTPKTIRDRHITELTSAKADKVIEDINLALDENIEQRMAGVAAGDDSAIIEYGAWIKPVGGYGWSNLDQKDVEFTNKLLGLTAGADANINDNIVAGVAAGYILNTTEFTESKDKVKITNLVGSVYGKIDIVDKFFTQAIATIGNADVKFQDKDGNENKAEADKKVSGLNYSVKVGVGYKHGFDSGSMIIPTLNYKYNNSKFSEYEQNGKSADASDLLYSGNKHAAIASVLYKHKSIDLGNNLVIRPEILAALEAKLPFGGKEGEELKLALEGGAIRAGAAVSYNNLDFGANVTAIMRDQYKAVQGSISARINF